jgi:hypothetical protein
MELQGHLLQFFTDVMLFKATSHQDIHITSASSQNSAPQLVPDRPTIPTIENFLTRRRNLLLK